MGIFKNEYKELWEKQKELTDKAIQSAEEWKKLCEEINAKFDQCVKKDLVGAAALIQQLRNDKERLELEIEMLKSRR